jgi:hypothetical protein
MLNKNSMRFGQKLNFKQIGSTLNPLPKMEPFLLTSSACYTTYSSGDAPGAFPLIKKYLPMNNKAVKIADVFEKRHSLIMQEKKIAPEKFSKFLSDKFFKAPGL